MIVNCWFTFSPLSQWLLTRLASSNNAFRCSCYQNIVSSHYCFVTLGIMDEVVMIVTSFTFSPLTQRVAKHFASC